MIEIEAPDGSIIEFPDGTDDATIDRVMRESFAPHSAPVAAPYEPPPVIATTPDGGKVYRMSDGGLSFSSPGMSTNDQAAIAQIMKGTTPAEASLYSSVNAGGGLGSAARSTFQGLTFGAGDEIVAAGLSLFGPNSYETELARERARLDRGRDERPVSSAASEIIGALTLPVGMASQAGSLPARMAKSAGVTGALSGAYGFLAGEGGAQGRMDNAKGNAVVGALIGSAIPVVGQIAQKGMDRYAASRAARQIARNAPSTEELKAAGRAAYKAIDDAGVVVKPGEFSDVVTALVDDMKAGGMRQGVGRELAPKSAALADTLTDVATDPRLQGGVPFSEIDTLRKIAGSPASDLANPLESALGSTAIGGLDDFITNLRPDQVVAGNADELPKMLQTARDIWGKMKRSQMIDDAIENSQNYMSGGASGIKNQFARILRNPRLARSFSESEKTMMRRVVNGSAPERILNLFSGGIGQLATILGGAQTAGAVGGLAGAGIAAGSRRAAEALSMRNAEVVRALIANGGLPDVPRLGSQVSPVIEALMQRGTAAAIQ